MKTKKALEPVDLICEECGQDATDGYTFEDKRYCTKCHEKVVCRSTRASCYFRLDKRQSREYRGAKPRKKRK